MAEGYSPFAPEDGDDDHGDLGALDFFTAADGEESSGLEAFDDYLPPAEPAVIGSADLWGDVGAVHPEQPAAIFTVTNPPGTVSVSAYLDGRVERIRLRGKSDAAEAQLADEILLIADLARQKARSAQHAAMLEEMLALGHDTASTRDFLARELHLPSPEEATAAEARCFAVRYAGEHD